MFGRTDGKFRETEPNRTEPSLLPPLAEPGRTEGAGFREAPYRAKPNPRHCSATLQGVLTNAEPNRTELPPVPQRAEPNRTTPSALAKHRTEPNRAAAERSVPNVASSSVPNRAEPRGPAVNWRPNRTERSRRQGQPNRRFGGARSNSVTLGFWPRVRHFAEHSAKSRTLGQNRTLGTLPS